MTKVTFNYLGAKCEYDNLTKNLHIISKNSFKSSDQKYRTVLSKKHNIKKDDVKTITFKYDNTELPEYVSSYFSNYNNLESIELNKLDFKNVKEINGFIDNCPKLKDITITNKEAKKLINVKYFIKRVNQTKTITIKNINIPNLEYIAHLIYYVKESIENIIIEDITAPNIYTLRDLIAITNIETLDLTNIGNVNVHTIDNIAQDCFKLKRIEINPLTNTKNIYGLIKNAPSLETNIINKINKIEMLNPYFLAKTPKNGALDLDKFETIDRFILHMHIGLSSDCYKYDGIKIGNYKLKLTDYNIIFKHNIPILDKTKEEIVKDIIMQSKNEKKEHIQELLNVLKYKKYYNEELIPKLNIIINLK